MVEKYSIEWTDSSRKRADNGDMLVETPDTNYVEIEDRLIKSVRVGSVRDGCICDFQDEHCDNKKKCVQGIASRMSKENKSIVLESLDRTMRELSRRENIDFERRWKESSSISGSKILDGFNLIFLVSEYNDIAQGLISYLRKSNEKAIEAPSNLIYHKDMDEKETIRMLLWMILCYLFGVFLCHPRRGWIINKDAAIGFLERISMRKSPLIHDDLVDCINDALEKQKDGN